jgi:glycosyltransferase involved in cell wall biosynthesis
VIRVDLVDPPAYSPPYDHALAAALARGGADVRVVTSRFAFGVTPPPDGYRIAELFYRHARGAAGSRLRTATKALEHLPDMLRYRTEGAAADVVHFQWLTLPSLDLRLLPDRPAVLTIHDPMARGLVDRLAPGTQLLRTLPAVIVHTDAARRAVVGRGLDPARVRVIRHGAFTHLTTLVAGAALPWELASAEGERSGGAERPPIALCFGLIRPYKGIETLLEAWRGIDGAELWIVGRPLFDIAALRVAAPANVRFVPRFVSDSEQAALLDRADVVVLPYVRGARFGFSGVLAAALGVGRPTVVSDVDGFAELVKLGAARSVPAGDAGALSRVLRELLADPQERERLAAQARAAATGPYSWDAVAGATLELYDTIRAK